MAEYVYVDMLKRLNMLFAACTCCAFACHPEVDFYILHTPKRMRYLKNIKVPLFKDELVQSHAELVE